MNCGLRVTFIGLSFNSYFPFITPLNIYLDFLLKMAQSKLNDLAGRLGKNPRGLGIGLKLAAAAGAAIYGITQSLYTGSTILALSSSLVSLFRFKRSSLTAGGSTTILFYFQLKGDNELSSSTESVVFRMTFIQKDSISEFHGFNIPLSMISVLAQGRLLHQPEVRTYKW